MGDSGYYQKAERGVKESGLFFYFILLGSFLPRALPVEIADGAAYIFFVPLAPIPFCLARPEYLASFAAVLFVFAHFVPPFWPRDIKDEYIPHAGPSQEKKARPMG